MPVPSLPTGPRLKPSTAEDRRGLEAWADDWRPLPGDGRSDCRAPTQQRQRLLEGELSATTSAWYNDEVDLIAFLQPGLTQAIAREPDRQAVPPAANRLREVLAGLS